MHDAHFHISDTLFAQIKKQGMSGIANACCPEEFDALCKMQKQYSFLISFGIHPWYADRLIPEQVLPYLEQADFIGEIGLDNTWCRTNPEVQKEIFETQLSYACQMQKSVILHVKGMEWEMLDFLKRYPNRYLVHWYSCSDFLEEYIDLDCYFTLGPSVDRDASVQNAAKKVPLDRILLESDGIEAMAWAKNSAETEVDYISVLQDSLQEIARIRGMDRIFLEKQMDSNFQRFIRR